VAKLFTDERNCKTRNQLLTSDNVSIWFSSSQLLSVVLSVVADLKSATKGRHFSNVLVNLQKLSYWNIVRLSSVALLLRRLQLNFQRKNCPFFDQLTTANFQPGTICIPEWLVCQQHLSELFLFFFQTDQNIILMQLSYQRDQIRDYKWWYFILTFECIWHIFPCRDSILNLFCNVFVLSCIGWLLFCNVFVLSCIGWLLFCNVFVLSCIGWLLFCNVFCRSLQQWTPTLQIFPLRRAAR